jgi:MFS family permease
MTRPHTRSPTFALFKFIVGGFQQGILTGTFTFNAELFPTEARHFNAVFCSLAWGLSAMTLPLLSYFSRDYSWRITQTIFCSAGVTLLLQILFMDESIRWLLANGKSKRAIRVIRGAAKMNSRNFEEVMLSYKNDTSSSTNLMTTTFDSDQEIAQNTRKMSLLDILRIPRLLRNALSIWFAWFTTALGFFAIYLTTTSLSGNPYLNFFLTATMEIPPAIIFYFTLNRLGRRISAMIPFMLLAIGLLMVGILQSFGPNSNTDIPIMIFQMIGMCGASGCFGAVFSYTPEMFPTNVRLDSIHFSVAFGATLGIYSSNVYNGDHRSTAPIVTYSRCLTSYKYIEAQTQSCV